jgi:phage terminase large subunit-like protein
MHSAQKEEWVMSNKEEVVALVGNDTKGHRQLLDALKEAEC